ncbi:hypothetical protein TSAR_004503 [Trichomalopsis sarcophagae]|uniref:Transposable element P transposase-like RNase H domain-containing protein n=1 Tax=Trichomalopsis sarcophagae TaxID=543379 RepID=A0A232EYP5_9HYME|nr:hypothetical protein TSAR_004503 [Trichomalopsis sarcophagae]
MAPGKSKNLSQLLKAKADAISSKERECVLMWDEMNSAEHDRSAQAGNHVLVFVLRGSQYNWRQHVAYYVSDNAVCGTQLSRIILDMLDYVEDIDFKKEKPYIERYERKIFYNYDTPHLLKCLRNNFRLHQMTVEGNNVSWDVMK